MAPVFSHNKVMKVSDESYVSTVPWSFFLSFITFRLLISLLFAYRKVRNSQKGVNRLSWLLFIMTGKTVICTSENNYQ